MGIRERASRGALAVATLLIAVTVSDCSGGGPSGTLHGRLQGIGGPAPGLARAWPGTITIVGSGQSRDVPVGDDGAYSVTLPTGEYTIVGHSPEYGDGRYLCQAQQPVTITAGATTTADTSCSMF
jgi:hypothetical protein